MRSTSQLSSAKLNIEVPDYCATHVPIHGSFSDEDSLGLILPEIEAKDATLQGRLDSLSDTSSSRNVRLEDSYEEEERDTFQESATKSRKPPSILQHYQDFVSQFLSIFLQSKFSRHLRGIRVENDPSELIRNLATNRCCPDVQLFRRVAIDPNLVASAMPDSEDNPGYADNGVAINQLARLLDVAVLQFLSSVNEHTDVYAVVWALDYMKNLLFALITSMNSLNSFGWYGAPHIRIRKGTAMGRRSVTVPLQAPIINPSLPLVVVGTPPTSPFVSPERAPIPAPAPAGPVHVQEQSEDVRDPVTGQRSPILSPQSQPHSPLAVHHVGMSDRGHHQHRGDHPAGTVSHSGSGTRPNNLQPGGGGGDSARRRHGILKIPSLELPVSPPRSPGSSSSASHSASPSPSSPLSPPKHHQPATERKRKVTPVPIFHVGPRPGTVTVNMGCIQEEEDTVEEDVDGNDKFLNVSSTPQSYSSMESIREEREGEEEFFDMDTTEREYLESARNDLGLPFEPPVSLVSGAVRRSSQHGFPPQMDTVPSIHHYGQSRSFPRIVNPSSELTFERDAGGSDNTERVASSPPPLDSPPDFSPSPSPIPNPYANNRSSVKAPSPIPPPPPAPKDLPDVDINLELATLLNGEGRISLIALLHAIAKFPQNKELWTEEVGERCFSLIQLCMDIGMPPQKDDVAPPKPSPAMSGQERRKRFGQQNTAFVKIGATPEIPPWRTHSKHTIEFAVNALIQCGTCSVIGCTTDTLSCRLKHFHTVPLQGHSAHSKLIRNMRRIHLHSPAIFRQALIKFAQPSKSSCRRVFQFLHIVLQYCMHGGEMYFNHLLVSVVVSVLSTAVDRMIALDINEQSIQDVS